MTPSPLSEHQRLVARLFRKLDAFVIEHQLGEVMIAPIDVLLSDEDVVQPDLLFIAEDHLSKITQKNITGVPDLVIEILSPGTEQRDRIIKRKLYGIHGAKEFWIVDPQAKTIEVIGWQGSDFKTLQVYPEGALFQSSLLKGFQFPVTDLFPVRY